MKKIVTSILMILFIIISFSIGTSIVNATVVQVLRGNSTSDTPNTGVKAYKIEKIYQKIKTGAFSTKDFNGFEFEKMNKFYNVNDRVVKISDSLSFGAEKKNSAKKAVKILEALIKTNFDYVEYLIDKKNHSTPFFRFHDPNNSKKYSTDKNGKAVANLKEGKYLVVNESSNEARFVEVKSKKITIDFGKDEVVPKYLYTKIQGVSKNQKIDDQLFSIGYGEKVTFEFELKIPKDKSVLDQLSFSFRPGFGLQVDQVNFPYTVQSIDKTQILAQGKTEKEVRKNAFNANPIENYQEYLVQLPQIAPENTGKTIIVKVAAHLPSILQKKVQLVSQTNGNFQMLLRSDVAEDTSLQTIKVKNRPDQDYSIAACFKYGKQEENVVTSKVLTHGANFVTYDGTTNLLMNGSKYILGRTNSKNEIFYYTGLANGQPIWKQVSGQKLSQKLPQNTKVIGELFNQVKATLEKNSAKIISTGGVLALDDEQYQEIEPNYNQQDYNKKRDEECNKSLLKLRGLPLGYTYFLMQVEAPSGYQILPQLFSFTVNGESIKNAAVDNIKIDHLIPDQEYAKQSYNAILNLKNGAKEQKGMSLKTRLALIFLGVILFIALICFAIIKWF